MLTLRTLGALNLVGPGGEEVGAVLAQPKRLALLVYLATAPPQGFHRRDALLTLFWPEQSESRARNALSQSLSFLRKNLPEAVLTSRGSEEVGIDARLMKVDVLEFQAAVEAESWAEALEHYRGDFLRGFHVTGATEFEEWMHGERGRLRERAASAGWALAREQVRRGALEESERTANRALGLVVPAETTVRRLIEVLAGTGDRVAALRFYQRFLETLKDGLDLEPTEELRELVARLRSEDCGGLTSTFTGSDLPGVVPLTLPVWGARPPKEEGLKFAGREEELAQLGRFLDGALEGRGRVAFITGDAGTGKTVLAREFCARSLATYSDLVVATGTCDPHTGLGDAYRPFREVLRLLTGDVESQWRAGSMSTQQAERLWGVLPASLSAILDTGPDLLDTFVPTRELAERATALGERAAPLRSRLGASENNPGEGPAASTQAALFEHYLKVLRAISKECPVLLILEDLQWADGGSLDLLFHLGRELEGSRILLVGLYRPAEVALGRNGDRHPLRKVEAELRMRQGDARVRLGEEEDRPFFDAIIDSEPNRLGDGFRDPLFHLTRGHALFTVELLRELQDERKIRPDERGRWVEGEALRWDCLPARVDAVIEERISRLPEALQRVLAVASVEGEQFTAEVVAAVLGKDPGELVALVGSELEKRHRLVKIVGVKRLRGRCISTFRFRHILFQKFLYDGLDQAERAYLHEKVGRALENLLGDKGGEHAVVRARHFREAGLVMEAVAYLQLAAEFDQRAYAYMECMALLEEAWRLLSTLPESVDRDQRELKILSRLSPTHLILGVMNDESKEALSRLKDLALKVNDADSLFEGCASDFARCHYLGEHEQGRLSLDRMEMYLSPSGKPGQWGEFQLFRGLNTLSLGQPKRAVQHLEECEALCSGHKDLSFPSVNMTQPLSVVLALKALVLGPLGFPGRAEECIKNAYAVQNPQSDSSEDLWVMSYEFLLRWILRDVEACCRVNDPFESVVDTLGILGWSSLGRFSRGWCASEVGDAEAAVTIMQSAITDLDRGGWLVWRPFLHALLAEPLCRIGKVEEALRLMNWALERIEATGERVQESEVNRVRGEVLLSLPRPDAFGAEAAFRRAIAVAQKQETKLYELRATTSLARRLRTQGREREAKKSLSRCYRWFTEGFEYRDLKEARALLEELG